MSVYPPLTTPILVCFHTTSRKEVYFFSLNVLWLTVSELVSRLFACRQTAERLSDKAFDLSLSHAACVSVDAFAHMHC